VTSAGVKRFVERVPTCAVRSDVKPSPEITTPKIVVPESDADRAIAIWALAKKGTVGLANPNRLARDVSELPAGPFQVVSIQVIVKNGPLKMPAFTELAEITHLELTAPGRLTDADVAGLGAMPKLWFLRLSGPITDAALPSMLRYPQLRVLGLAGTKITAVGLATVAKRTALENLRLAGSAAITDAGLAAFAGHARLTTLDLTNCRGITDACLPTLKSLPKLAELFVEGTGITEAGAAKLAAALPRCRIVSNFEPTK
jgi:hypothetical protein